MWHGKFKAIPINVKFITEHLGLQIISGSEEDGYE